MSSNLETDTLSRWAMLAAIAQCFSIEQSPKIFNATVVRQTFNVFLERAVRAMRVPTLTLP